MNLPAQLLVWSTLVSISVATESCIEKTKFATVDDNFTVYFGRCEDCYCVIIGAWMKHPAYHKIPYNGTTFWVNFIQGELTNGSHHYEFGYGGFCLGILRPHFCLGRGIFLHLRIADFQLTVKSTNITVGNNISLHCNSGLETSNDIQTIFIFTSLENDTQINMTCESNSTTDKHFDHWRISRSHTSPHDCYLGVMNASITDGGIYQCAGRLPTDVAGEYKLAFSNSLTIRIEGPHREPGTDAFNIGLSVVIALIVVSILVLVLIVPQFVSWKRSQARSRILEASPEDSESDPLIADGISLVSTRTPSPANSSQRRYGSTTTHGSEGYIGDVDVPVDVYTSSSSFGVEESTEVVVSLDETQLSTATEEPYHSEADIVDTGQPALATGQRESPEGNGCELGEDQSSSSIATSMCTPEGDITGERESPSPPSSIATGVRTGERESPSPPSSIATGVRTPEQDITGERESPSPPSSIATGLHTPEQDITGHRESPTPSNSGEGGSTLATGRRESPDGKGSRASSPSSVATGVCTSAGDITEHRESPTPPSSVATGVRTPDDDSSLSNDSIP